MLFRSDLAGNVRGLRASGGASLGGYRYSAFGQTLEDTTSITQPLRWKSRWFSPVAGGTYDVRARQWSPELGIFLTVDEYEFHDVNSTLWGWPNQNPVRFRDPHGREGEQCIYQPPDSCRRDPSSKACRWDRCPKATREHCVADVSERVRACIAAQTARGVPWAAAAESCNGAAEGQLDLCMEMFCPP